MKNVSLEIGANPPQERKSFTTPKINDDVNINEVHIKVNDFDLSKEKVLLKLRIPPYPLEQENMTQHNERLQATR